MSIVGFGPPRKSLMTRLIEKFFPPPEPEKTRFERRLDEAYGRIYIAHQKLLESFLDPSNKLKMSDFRDAWDDMIENFECVYTKEMVGYCIRHLGLPYKQHRTNFHYSP